MINDSDWAQGAGIVDNDPWGRRRLRDATVLPLTSSDRGPMMISFYPLQDRTTTHAAAIYYRDRAKTWRARAAAVPNGARHQAAFREIADGYEKIAGQYEQREQLERG